MRKILNPDFGFTNPTIINMETQHQSLQRRLFGYGAAEGLAVKQRRSPV